MPMKRGLMVAVLSEQQKPVRRPWLLSLLIAGARGITQRAFCTGKPGPVRQLMLLKSVPTLQKPKGHCRIAANAGGGGGESVDWSTWIIVGVFFAFVQAQETARQTKEAARQTKEAARQREEAFRQSDEYKIQRVVRELMEPQPLPTVGNFVETEMVPRLRRRVQGWGQHATLIAGLFGAGKTTALNQALAGLRGVLVVVLDDQVKCKKAVYDSLGVENESMFEKVLRSTTAELRSTQPAPTGLKTTVPVIVLDIPRNSQVDIGSVSTFAKKYASDATDDLRVHVIALMSSATAALGFDAGGRFRQHDMWLEFKDEEASQLLQQSFGVEEPEATKIVKLVGTNPVRLERVIPKVMAETIKAGGDARGAINRIYQEQVSDEVTGLLALKLEDADGNKCDVGRELAGALLEKADKIDHEEEDVTMKADRVVRWPGKVATKVKSLWRQWRKKTTCDVGCKRGAAVGKESEVSHGYWLKKGIMVNTVAARVKSLEAHAIFFHTQERRWRWVSPLHREEAQKQLASAP